MPPPDERRRRFEQVYAACHDPVLGYVLRRTGNAHDAADVLAETFLTAWRRLDDMPAGDAARPWLFAVARRILANHRRGERRRSELDERLRSELNADLAPAYPVPEYDGELAAAGAAFRTLSDDDRELLSLAGWEGLDAGEIATVLGCSRNAVRVRLHRARRRFARALDDRAPGDRAVDDRVVGGEAVRAAAPRAVRVAKGDHA